MTVHEAYSMVWELHLTPAPKRKSIKRGLYEQAKKFIEGILEL